MNNYTLFISDLHLCQEETQITEAFLSFLKNEAPKADALYILGDLFKLWIGDDDASPYATTIKNALKQLNTKISVFLMPGNRDFLLGHQFAMESGVTLIKDPTKIDLYGTPTLLTHGDILCSGDLIHRIFRCMTRPLWAVRLFLKLPFRLRESLAKLTQKVSVINKKVTAIKNEQTPQKTIESIMQRFNVQQIIYGHIHKARITEFHLRNVAARAIVLGEWNEIGDTLIYSSEHKLARL